MRLISFITFIFLNLVFFTSPAFCQTSEEQEIIDEFLRIIIAPNQTDGVIPKGTAQYKISKQCSGIFLINAETEETFEFVLLKKYICQDITYALIRLINTNEILMVDLTELILFE